MELKRYVLLANNTIVEFYKNETFGFSYIENKIDGIVFTRSAFMKNVKKTSDNILDLVEVGDLVEIDQMTGIYYIDRITDKDGSRVFTCDQKYGYWFDFNEREVKAIYKHQKNGDYKGYVLLEKELEEK